MTREERLRSRIDNVADDRDRALELVDELRAELRRLRHGRTRAVNERDRAIAELAIVTAELAAVENGAPRARPYGRCGLCGAPARGRRCASHRDL